MQHGLRSIDSAARLLRPTVLASSSRQIQWEARRHASFGSPLNWLRERLGPNLRKKESKQEVEAAKQQAAEEGKRSLFETASKTTERAEKAARAEKRIPLLAKPRKPRPDFHKYSTANFKISHRKLNMIGRQISGKPIDYAILQMQFSEKRASNRIRSMLATAKEHAVRYKALEESKLVIAEAWVSKGPRQHKRMEPKGRAHYGVRVHPDSRLHVVLREGKTLVEQKAEERERKLKRIVSASLVREDRPIRNPAPTWGW